MKKIKKIATSFGIVGKILNAFSNSTENTYCCDYINKIIESGSNENNYYTKLADGTLINYGLAYFTASESSEKIITFAHPFINTNYGFSMTCAWNYKNKIFFTTSPGEVDKIILNLYDETGATITTNQQVRYIAIGRWK